MGIPLTCFLTRSCSIALDSFNLHVGFIGQERPPASGSAR
jgi:hypothetical protein